ncbi:hypothetical protein Cali_218 [Mycobacterium phage Cali]|uniref:Uncharacterized protein n=38 Tax=Bixzunavirus TaxID=680114 RepID=Q852Z1_BPMBZ|nr:gp214 [Mycobacterium phage Bxz1]YP_002224216.1 hypothetical protein SCOTTMCG_219 [Mycobacterium phage ScottMcG]YP_002224438.1 gp219 [Mycobacterium phage Spud]YP_002224660.1 gp218 [Mycobacterium phage Cali]YP_002224880.1 gp217 [Mycobacterium phage Rizal]YP_008060995.1 hypothetical protein M181_gp132 [Mycobacterium phage Gizmo]YP_008061453.1 hypothetical protein M180_gp127 [Mycobacterium phage ArcherS7]YP_008061683.1 hypothetical protein M182_gp127 [Mycobacterium phage Astraea]YP_009012976
MTDTFVSEIKDLYPTEKNALNSIRHQLMQSLAWKPTSILFTEDMMKRQFEAQARERCAEIGLVVEVQWTWKDVDKTTGEVVDMSPDVADDPNDLNLYWKPRLIVVGRTDKIGEIDHDRFRHEVVTGEADGKAGYVDPNTGLMRDDSRKKDIL